jgi:predicted nucleic-acid-binding Zn-ribbon protein
MDNIRQGVCPVCRHNEIIQAELLVDGERNEHQVALARGTEGTSVFARMQNFGVMHAFTCRHCGYTQLFAESPATVPIGDRHRTRLIVGPTGG